MKIASTYGEEYLEYVLQYLPKIDLEYLALLEEIVETTNWENPQTSSDWNNLAVINLIKADKTQDLLLREQLVNEALQYLQRGFIIDQNWYCIAHCIIIHGLIGNGEIANSFAMSILVDPYSVKNQNAHHGLIFLPRKFITEYEAKELFNVISKYNTIQKMIGIALRESQQVFYNDFSFRFLKLSQLLWADNPKTLLKLGIHSLMIKGSEGLVYLLKAWQLSPNTSRIIHALYLGYCEHIKNMTHHKDYFLNIAKQQTSQDYQWSHLVKDNVITYITYDEDIQLAVEPDFNSLVTSVLLAESDWFEYEIEFWRDSIEEGMVVIDIGANVGVYTFSAARRVGANGKVIAVEPLPKCIDLLKETCHLNNFSNVLICESAVSNQVGKVKFSTDKKNETNQVLLEEKTPDQVNTITVDALTLDTIPTMYNLEKIDFIKIDAEGHEMQVFHGATEVLKVFKPKIMYENVDGVHRSNLPVANYLRDMEYDLFYYQPYLKKLIAINSNSDLENRLNIIALPRNV